MGLIKGNDSFMKEESLTSPSLVEIALLRAYANMDSSTRALLGSCQLLIARNSSYWYIAFAAPNSTVWKRIVKRLESITRRLERTMSSFMLAVCTTDDPVLPGGLGVGRVKRLFQVNEVWFVQVGHDDHPYWIEVIPEDALTLVPPPRTSGDNDEEDDLEIPF